MLPIHQHLSNLILDSNYQEAERLAIDHVRMNPADGQGWLYLGESLLRQQEGEAAKHFLNRAQLLDPEAKWLDLMQNELNRTPVGNRYAELSEVLSVRKTSVAAAIIVKNEERCIERCIQSIQNAVDEIIVVDSGSTDQTLSLLSNYPNVKLYQVEWTDSFALLRNEALAHVSSEWVFWLDADEWLNSEDSAQIRLVAGIFHSLQPVIPMIHPCIVNHIQGSDNINFSVPRMFPTDRGVHYQGRIHEQIATEREGIFTTNVFHKPVQIRLHHDGYELEVRNVKEKIKRNIRLLRMMTEEEPTNPGWWYFLGRETMESNDRNFALDYFDKAIQYGASNPRFGRMPEIYMLMARAHLVQNNIEKAEECCFKALELHPDFPDAHYQLASIKALIAQTSLNKAMDHLNLALDGFHSYRGTVSADHEIHTWKADALKADLLVHLGKLSEAKLLLEQLQTKSPVPHHFQQKLLFIEQQHQLLRGGVFS
jgi:glycosyltransferase involved in cell wall biosynthesis